jgi:hypothetical protein
MKKLVMLSVIGIMSLSSFGTIEAKSSAILTMRKYNVYCDGRLTQTIWASSQSMADAIAHNICNP